MTIEDERRPADLWKAVDYAGVMAKYALDAGSFTYSSLVDACAPRGLGVPMKHAGGDWAVDGRKVERFLRRWREDGLLACERRRGSRVWDWHVTPAGRVALASLLPHPHGDQ